MINKNSAHFKIAAYSVKHPKHVYLGLGAIFVLCTIGALVLGLKFGNSGPIMQDMPASQASITSKNNWIAKKKIPVNDRAQCIMYEHQVSHDRLISCYKQLQSGEWVFEYSY